MRTVTTDGQCSAEGGNRIGLPVLRPAGHCHCGAVQLDLELSKAPDELRLRACQCDFCRPRGVRTIADPEGRAVIRASGPEALNRYRFGLRLADYILCGTYVAAIQPDEPPIAVVNVGGLAVPEFTFPLDDLFPFDTPPSPEA